MQLNRFYIYSFATLILVFSALNAQAQVQPKATQLHLRFGPMGGSYDGPIRGVFFTETSFDMEYEVFKSNDFSYAFRALLALEMPEAKPFYTYFGTGFRWYFNSRGPYTEAYDSRVSIRTTPTWRYYAGLDFGVSQVIIRTFGDVLQIISSMVEVGGSIGTIYQLTPHFGVEGKLNVSTGYGFTSIALVGVTYGGYLGGVYYF